MGHITLEGMTFYAHHGYYTDERKLGNHYHVDISVEYDMEQAAVSDKLEEALNYEVIYAICKGEMARPRHLIESVAHSIAHGIRSECPAAGDIRVTVRKEMPGLGGPVRFATVTFGL